MKLNHCFQLTCLLFLSLCTHAQHSLRLQSGTVETTPNLRQGLVDSLPSYTVGRSAKSFAVLQFSALPSEATRKELSAQGIELLEYIPDNAYTASISGRPDAVLMKHAGVHAVVQLKPRQKMEVRLAAGILPASAVRIAGTVDVWISFPKTCLGPDVVKALRELNMDVQSLQYMSYRILALRVSAARLEELAALPFVEYVQPAPGADKPLNFNSRAGSRANLLNASIADGGKGLNGEGVVLGIGDNADVAEHVDFAGRLIDRSASPPMGHGTHTTGTMAGAGNGNELYRGYAPKATIVSQDFSNIITNAATYVHDYGMVVTNNSYGDNIDCGSYGTYDLYSRLLDQMAFDLPYLVNVFSAGNSGLEACSPFQSSYHTVLGGYQSAKNVITVGATTDSGQVSDFSSRGPVRDGRLKPEITAMGQFVASSWPFSTYSYNNGTSMSAPAVSGGLALLYQRYRQLNGNANPKNGLMKAILCNGASDRGNAGPDFQNGFGWMNLLRSVDMIEQGRYFTGTSTNGTTNTQTIAVPANTTQLKVMLYWNDPAASPLSANTLVNDLDLEVSDPSNATVLPRVLDTANAALNNVSVTGADHINNMEQVIVNNPAAGTYTLKVKGTAITQNPSQEYFLVYDAIPVQLKLTAPAGGETYAPSTSQYDMLKISWEAYGFTSGTANIELSIDNGVTWSTVAANVDINRVVYTWWVPNVATSQAFIRITKNGTGETAMSNRFTILGQPTVTLSPNQCEGYININWTSVPGATDYEVMILRGGDMRSEAFVPGPSYSFHGLSKDTMYAVTVRARINGVPGRRPSAALRQPNDGDCTASISNHDLKTDAIVAPVSGRHFTSSQPSSASVVTVRIKNLDDISVSNYTLHYRVNGGSVISEAGSTALAPNSATLLSFNTTADLSAIGIYTVAAWVTNNDATDPDPSNDTAYAQIRHLDNQPLSLASPFLDDMENAAVMTYEKDTVGLTGLDRYDFLRGGTTGRLRTFINTGIAYSGDKALTLDLNQFNPAGATNYLTGTYNLSAYTAATNNLRLDFQFNSHGQQPHPNNRVWIRGNDTQPWIQVYDLDANAADPGTYQRSSSIELSDLLTAAGQNFSTSFQVRWGEFGQTAASDRQTSSGLSFDDIRLYEAPYDLQMRSIDAPTASSCALSNATVIKVTIRNSSTSVASGAHARYRINNGSWVTEALPDIPAKTSISYSFNTPADLSALGSYTIQTVVDGVNDNFHDNDTATLQLNNLPVISSYPYLQDFESGAGSWYAEGRNSSWEYGTPGSQKISSAASGAKAWKTRLKGHYNDNELSYLYSPCFDLTGMTHPTLSFSAAIDLEDCGTTLCDAAWVEYSPDGVNWTKLGSYGSGTNWYNVPTGQLWSEQDATRWHVATTALPPGQTRLRLRFVMNSDPATNREGLGIDDIHIYDNIYGIYDGATMTAPVTQNVSGSNWIDFTSGSKLVASVQPNGQVMGTTDVQAYINTGAVRYTSSQYYHDRNLTIKPASQSADSVSVRFYFLDTEVDTLTKATGCSTCSKPASAYELGVSKYTDPDRSFENGTISDDQQGVWKFIPPAQVKKVPFDKGYYAEFKVKDLSELWLNNGTFTQSQPLPVKLLNFTAQRSSGDDVLLQWQVASETDVLRYDIELARGNDDLQNGRFGLLASVPGLGNTTGIRNYSFTDREADKFGPRYYRLKTVNADGSFSYSAVRAVIFGDAVLWNIYPNPSSGLFNLVFQLNTDDLLSATVLDAKGSTVRSYRKIPTGFVQKLNIDLTGMPGGVYLLQLNSAARKISFKLYKQ